MNNETNDKNLSIAFISLGCDKNRVDLEEMIGKVSLAKLNITNDINEADVVLINTCAFILSARQESEKEIESVLNIKQSNNNLKVIVTGCYPQKSLDYLKEKFKSVDLFLPLSENKNLINHINSLFSKNYSCGDEFSRVLTTPSHIGYLKIADGCNNVCSYCTIPRIRGVYKSKSLEQNVFEATKLVQSGVKEILLVAQDVTRYGFDLYGEYKLVNLIRELSNIEGLKKIRLHYCYPELISDELINEIKCNDKVCKYIDMPLQHASDKILKSMRRRNTQQEAIDLINKIRNKIPQICIRSTFIVGYPGETKKDFSVLKNFIKSMQLDKVGFFSYSKEEGTIAGQIKKQVPNFIKKYRLKVIQQIQQKIMLFKSKFEINKIKDVIVDYYDENTNYYFARDDKNSFLVDNIICFEKHENNDIIKVSDTVSVVITDIAGNDLIGEIYEFTK